MAKPIPRRRGGTVESDAPDADAYAPRARRSAEPEEPEEERRPRRGRGELPSAKDDAPLTRRDRGAKAAPEPEPEGDDYPETLADLVAVSDEDYDALLDEFKIDDDLNDVEAEDALWDAITATRAPKPTARSRRGRAAEPEEEKPSPRRGRSNREEPEEDEDDEPPRRTAGKGFKGFKKTKDATSSYADDFKLSDEEVLVKFLEDEPFATYGEHGLYDELKRHGGQRVWTCLSPEEQCGICDTGHRARPVALWNIVVIPEEGTPELKVLKAGPALEKVIEQKAGLKSGPMGKEYYSLSQTPGKNDGPPTYAVEVQRERELETDWSFKPFSTSELKDWAEKSYDETFVKFPTVKQIKDIANILREED